MNLLEHRNNYNLKIKQNRHICMYMSIFYFILCFAVTYMYIIHTYMFIFTSFVFFFYVKSLILSMKCIPYIEISFI